MRQNVKIRSGFVSNSSTSSFVMIGVPVTREEMAGLAGKLSLPLFSYVPPEDEYSDPDEDWGEEEFLFSDWARGVARQVGLSYSDGVLGKVVADQYGEGNCSEPFTKVSEALSKLREALGEVSDDRIVLHIHLTEP